MPGDYEVDYKVNSDAKILDFTNGYSVGSTAAIAAICGPISYTVALGTNLEIVNMQPVSDYLSIYSDDDENMIGESRSVVIQSTLRDYAGIISGTDLTITINFVNCTVAETNVALPELIS